MLWLGILCGILAVAVVLLSVKIFILKKSINEIGTGFEECLHKDTNVLISVSYNKDLGDFEFEVKDWEEVSGNIEFN